MSIQRQIERAQDKLEKLLDEGAISQKEFNEEMRDLQREYMAAAEEAAEAAYRDEMGQW